MTKNKEYLDAMNKLDKQLEPDDKKYFTDLRSYMVLSSVIVEEKAVNEQIYQMYLDFTNAENEGLTAVEYFGNEPKEMADELIKSLPTAPVKNIIQYTGIVAGILWGMRLISDFSRSIPMTINPALYLFDVFIGLINILVLFQLIKRSIYSKTNQFVEMISAAASFMFFVVIYLKAEQFIPEIFAFTVPYPWDILLISSIGLITFSVILFLKERPFYSVGFSILFFVSIGVVLRFEAANNLQMPLYLKLIIFAILGLGFYLANKYLTKEK